MDQTPYYTVLGLNLLAGLLWTAAGIAAFTGWRAFRQRADLAWLGAFVALAFAAFSTAANAWQMAQGVDTLSGGGEVYAQSVLPGELRLSALTLIAALLAVYAFVQRRSL